MKMICMSVFLLNMALVAAIVLHVLSSDKGKILGFSLKQLLVTELILLFSICIAGFFDFGDLNKVVVEEGYSLCGQYFASSAVGLFGGLIGVLRS